MVSRVVGPGNEKFFPADGFWVLPAKVARRQGGDPCVIRVRLGPQPHQATLEVAAGDLRQGSALIERLVRISAEQSIYRNHLLDLEVAGQVRDEEGNIEHNENLDLVFKSPPRIGPDDIVLDEDVAQALERNVLDFHRRRDALTALGLPSRRGVLLYGPPGTGKTYTCKYLASQLAGTITTLVASGESLLRVRTICNLARMLQPALIVLEDVDLVYAARDSGLGHNASLGKLMDELDGFGRDDRIIFVLTTNAIDRVERAISDRPGRISQCVFLGPPSDPLRHRYLRTQLTPFDGAALDLERLTRLTAGTTQAFLKELVFRAVQIASLGAPPAGTNGQSGKLALRDEHFATAMTEMRSTGGRAGETIIGFRAAGF
jgi:SpoVK/Ycf46/Vps4 family AAA+-type ATPase